MGTSGNPQYRLKSTESETSTSSALRRKSRFSSDVTAAPIHSERRNFGSTGLRPRLLFSCVVVLLMLLPCTRKVADASRKMLHSRAGWRIDEGMGCPKLETRTITQYRLPGTDHWYSSKRGALTKAAFIALKSKCSTTASGHYCDAEETRCKWHSMAPFGRRVGSGTFAALVAHRLVRLWLKAAKKGQG